MATATVSTTMRALTVRQPWAAAIIWGGKDVENRSRPTNYRGRLWIHAGSARPAYGDFHDAWWLSSVLGTTSTDLAGWTGCLGAVLGSVELVDCHPSDDCNHICPEPEDWDGDILPCTEYDGPCRNHCSPWAWADRWHWVLRDPQPLMRPFAAKGQLGMWKLPDAPVISVPGTEDSEGG